MPRRTWNDGQEINFNDFDAIGPCIEREVYDRVVQKLCEGAVDSFFAGSFLATYASGTTVSVAAGLGFQQDLTQVSPEPTFRPMYLGEAIIESITAPDATHPRWDILCVKNARVAELTGTRKYKDPVSDAITDVVMNLQSDWEADVAIVAGTPGVAPTKPAVPTGYIKIAELYVYAGTGMSGSADVLDTRTLMPYGALSTMSTLGFTSITALSSRSLYDVMSNIDALLTANKKRGIPDWNATYTYVAGDVVQNGTGTVYYAKASSTNIAVTDTSKWRPMFSATGVFITRPDGTLRELSIDDSDNIVIKNT
jgi:hypothetical protein